MRISLAGILSAFLIVILSLSLYSKYLSNEFEDITKNLEEGLALSIEQVQKEQQELIENGRNVMALVG
ncbi:hypothetical protein M3202_18545 [Alkalihalobacillus oceani]|uniref:Uncharacterized protein n=1 Tax=Halalkalibacter oceani TaxID=1653776 RepID=A0A9X2DTY3_9BACI|nr:hypothetical protein [Halalkalibacter oceani]MCM3716055.1 hypothetical protein [Halalkalibacter oceani]